MKATFVLAALFSAAFAAPIAQGDLLSGLAAAYGLGGSSSKGYGGKGGSCTFSAFESFNLLHGHDVNTGKIKLGSIITPTPIAIGGSGCSPAWAVGGKIDDDTPTRGSSLF